MFQRRHANGAKVFAGGPTDWKNGFSKLIEHKNSVNHMKSHATLKERGRLTGRDVYKRQSLYRV